MKTIILSSVLLLFGFQGYPVIAAEKKSSTKPRFENDQLIVRLLARSPDQIAAFYEARGFPSDMIKALKKECFITVGIKNKSSDILWLDLSHWSFSSHGKPVKRFHRNEWKHTWQSMNVPMPSQSTFRWTLLPELLDFRPDEREGGNIILERTGKPFNLTAYFMNGHRTQGKKISVEIDNIKCAEDKQ